MFFCFFLLQRRVGEFKWLQSLGFANLSPGFSVVWGGEQELLLLEHGQEIFSPLLPFFCASLM